MTDTPKEIETRLEPIHIKKPDLEEDTLPSDKDLRDAVAKDAEEQVDGSTEKTEQSRSSDPRSKTSFTFQFQKFDSNGNAWLGSFTTKILSIDERQKAGILRSQLGGGMPIESLDSLTNELNMIISHMTFSFTETPKWAESLRTISDFSIVQDLYKEVASHEAFFLGW